MRGFRDYNYITCQCGLCKSPHEECGPTHQLLPVHTFCTTHWELKCTEIVHFRAFHFLQCKLCIYTLFCEVISVSLHMSVITQDGNSALMEAASWGMTEVVSLLLKAGANIHLHDKVPVSVHVQEKTRNTLKSTKFVKGFCRKSFSYTVLKEL